ncbi:hypothetical protein EV421DRAFT_1742702 [Armillaria borealis]|uniref:Uncharacterized protein n=1 Tax=Armillaria borealis TaxID=47425 RepID=A0AA39IWY2_9AGAR|nr:hypothetical protein EV421DRAFT_1742702 [Armillaria borealis]
MSSCKVEIVIALLASMISPAWLSTLLVVIFLSGGAFLHGSILLLKPSTAIHHLATTIDQAMTVFHAHTNVLGTFRCRLLLCELLALSRRLRQADDAFLWSDRRTWLRYISRLKKIWNDTRDNQRAVDALRKHMRDVIFAVEEERSRAEAEIAHNRENIAVFNVPYQVAAAATSTIYLEVLLDVVVDAGNYKPDR